MLQTLLNDTAAMLMTADARVRRRDFVDDELKLLWPERFDDFLHTVVSVRTCNQVCYSSGKLCANRVLFFYILVRDEDDPLGRTSSVLV